MKKQYKSSITKNYKIEKCIYFNGVPLIGYVVSEVVFRFCTRNLKKHCGKIKGLMTLKFRSITNM